MFIKTTFKKTHKISKELDISVFLDITKVVDFQWKNVDVSRTQEVCHVIYILFGSSLGKA